MWEGAAERGYGRKSNEGVARENKRRGVDAVTWRSRTHGESSGAWCALGGEGWSPEGGWRVRRHRHDSRRRLLSITASTGRRACSVKSVEIQ
jgi:hypothetical protein